MSWFLSFVGLGSSITDTSEAVIRLVVQDVRRPRILLTFLVGVSLSASGVALQAVFRNPLVSSYILGLQSGAAFGFSTLAASAAVSVTGVVGMVGLVIPHMVRMMIGADNRMAVPVCCTFGGAFLVLVDNISRSATAFEIPIGIFTTLVGGPFFIVLLKRAKIGWEL